MVGEGSCLGVRMSLSDIFVSLDVCVRSERTPAREEEVTAGEAWQIAYSGSSFGLAWHSPLLSSPLPYGTKARATLYSQASVQPEQRRD